MARSDVTGQRFGKLIAIRDNETVYKTNREWVCLCDCGNECLVTVRSLRAGNVKSCGCLKGTKLRKNRGVLSPGEAAWNLFVHQYKTNARKRNLEWALSDEELYILSQMNCHYCGVKPSRTVQTINKRGSVIVNGIDRRDNTLGYTITNCVASCAMCNRSKMDLSMSEFQDWMARASSHMNLQLNG